MKVLVNFIQDRSGSMSTVWAETVSGFKGFTDELKIGAAKDSVEYFLTLTTFDTLIEIPLQEKSLSEITGDELKSFGPRGSTALYDAVGKTLEETKQGDYDKILTVIVTDGQENSSREWSKDALHKSIEAKIALGNWTFTYLGTQPETWDEASSLGVGIGASSTYTAQNAASTYKIMGTRAAAFSASSKRSTTDFLSDKDFGKVDDLDEMAKAGMSVNVGQAPPKAAPAAATPPAQKPKDSRSWR